MKNIQSILLSHKTVEGAKYLLVAFLAIIFLVEFTISFDWRARGDSVFIHYLAYLINEHGFLPYRDLFEINMPGTYLFHIAIGKLFGYSDNALRMVNIGWFTATLVVTWFIIKPFGWVTALVSCLLFGIIQLGFGPDMSLQRDFIVILPIATAILIIIQPKKHQSFYFIPFLLGLLFAFVALVKPYHAIGLPILVIYHCIYNNNKTVKSLLTSCIVGGLFALFGFLLILIIPFLWLWQIGALQAFWDISSSYTSLYAQISGDLKVRETASHIMYLFYSYTNFKKLGILLIASFLGVYFILTKSSSIIIKRLSVLLILLSICYAISAAIGGKLWLYHMMPHIYFVSLSAGIIFYSFPLSTNSYPLHILSLLVFIIVSVPIIQHSISQQVFMKWKTPYELSKDIRQDEITAYLNAHLSPNDKVQPLSWAGGTLEAMLASKAVPATQYITDFQFYHHVSTPYIQNLRKDFITKLEKEMPRFIIDVYTSPKLSGLDTSYDFPALKNFIKKNYKKTYIGNGFNVFQRNDK